MGTDSPPGVEPPSGSTRSLDRSLIHGIAWTGVGRWIVQIISWIATPIVARLLSPRDYGVASMAVVYTGLVQMVNEFGLGVAIVQRRDLTDDQIARLGGLSALLGVFFLALSVGLSSPIARFFENSDVGPVIAVLSVTFVTSGFQTLPRALLIRDLRFRQLAMLDGLEALVQTGTTLTLAALGFGYWALVLGTVTSRTVGMIVVLLWRGHRLTWPTPFRTIAAPITVGFHIVAGNIAWYLYGNADLAIIGRRLGTAALGTYTIALTLASIPVERLSAHIAGATPAIFSRVQHDRSAVRRYLLALTEGIALLTFPAAVGLALVAEEFVLVVLGEQWREAIVPLRILALVGMYRSVFLLFGRVLMATGHSKRNMQATLALLAVLPPLFFVASRWGTVGIALVWLTVYPLLSSAFAVKYAFVMFEITWKSYLRVLWPAGSATVVMAAVVLAIGVLGSDGWPPALALGTKCVVGVVTYAALVWGLHRGRLRAFIAIVRERESSNASELQAPVSVAQSPGT